MRKFSAPTTLNLDEEIQFTLLSKLTYDIHGSKPNTKHIDHNLRWVIT